MPDALQQRCQHIVTSPVLTPEQKRHFLALEAENNLPYPALPEAARAALDEGFICDMFEGHAPYKPRYVLPDYAKFLANGSEWLELEGAKDLDDALSLLAILYHHVPSVTSMPVYLGQLDEILTPYVKILTQDEIDSRIKRFWRYLDRTLPDAFMHANIGPADTPVTRAILRADAELKQVAPNLTFIYDPDVTPDDLLLSVAKNICECSKPHISNGPLIDKIFTKGRYGVVSCYNSLPLAGGGSTLVRLNLKAIAEHSHSPEDFFTRTLPHYCQQQMAIVNARCDFLYEQSGFFENSFLVKEGLIDADRFVPMFGMYGLAEAVNVLCEKAGIAGRYGKDEQANALGYRISEQLAAFVENTPVKHGWKHRAMLHAQSGISSDSGTTPGRACLTATSRIPSATCWPWRHITSTITRGSAIFSPWMRRSNAILRRWYSFAWGRFAPVCANLPPTSPETTWCASPGIWCGSPIWKSTGRPVRAPTPPGSARRPRAIPAFWNVSHA